MASVLVGALGAPTGAVAADGHGPGADLRSSSGAAARSTAALSTSGPTAPSGAPLVGPTSPVHDPTIVRQGATWYVYSTGSRLPVRASEDLVHWRDVGVVFPGGLPAWLTAMFPGSGDDAWAPDVSWFGGAWHLYYAKAVFGTQDGVIGLATSPTLDPTDPAYGWTDQGVVLRSHPGDTVVAIDPNVVIDEGGDPWLVWGSFWDGIVIARLDPTTGRTRPGEAPTRLAGRDPWWLGIEGANVVFRDGWWWLYASFGFCCRGTGSFYSVHVGRSRSLTGPYLDQAGTPMLANGGTLVTGSHGNQVGIGHGTVFDTGDEWALVHHFYDADHAGAPTMGFTPLVDLDGWPLGVDAGFRPATDPGTLAVARWRLQGYREDEPAHPVEQVEVTLLADGMVAGGGRWSRDGQIVRLADVPVTTATGDMTRRAYALLVDAEGTLALGRDDRTAAVRAERVGEAPPPSSSTSPTTTTVATSAAPTGTVTPAFTG